jgi:drug/metabolite transporter (DMT)-like permease
MGSSVLGGTSPVSPAAKAHCQLHFCVFLWGFTSILGKLITLSALDLVWWRMLLVVGALLCFPQVWRGLRGLSPGLLLAYGGIGLVLTAHWLTFYWAIKLANASVAATCLALAPVLLSLVEPVIAGRSVNGRELVLGVAAVPGVVMVVGGIPSGMRVGVLVGAVSSFFVAVFGALNKRLIRQADPLTIMCAELGIGAIALSLVVVLRPHAGPILVIPDLRNAILLAILSIVCTLLPFALALGALRHVTAFAAQLVVNLEPIYSIVLAILILGEQHVLAKAFYAGVAIVLGAVLLYPATQGRSPLPQSFK